MDEEVRRYEFAESFPEQSSAYTIDSLRFYIDQHGKYHYY